MTIAIARDPIYRNRRFQSEIIELCVRWYLTYRLSYRDLVEMMAERGIAIWARSRHEFARNLLAHGIDPAGLKAALGKHGFIAMMREWGIQRGALSALEPTVVVDHRSATEN
jgi:hypothetical protein